ncbi:DNA alkylation repair enzyme [Beggiatoa sp. PS]|nr:DNA alkylation repair enzyme [Beggiatoa sp. PS]
MFFPCYVELYGLNEYEDSILALEYFTEFSSSEFAVRPFIKKYNRRMMVQMEKWAESSNHHVRRLASEGCRPRLPWAMALPEFKENPAPVLKILEKLKDDDSEYVRRSVANNLNDISKDNPLILIDVAQKWLGKNPNMDRLVKHACRSLLKQGQPKILELFGFVKPDHISIEAFKIQESVNMGENLEFSFILKTQQGKLGKLRIEYAVDFLKNNGKLSRKLFKISESDYSGSKKVITKHHSFKNISTRKYYTGIHGLAVIVNGKELAKGDFGLSEKA